MNKKTTIEILVRKAFGDVYTFKIDEERLSANYCIQEVVFVDVQKEKDGAVQSVVLKLLPDSIYKLYYAQHYSNEVLWYQEIVPEMGGTIMEVIPEFYYGTPYELCGQCDSAIVLQNLEQCEFRASKNKFLREDEMMEAVKSLGKLHGEHYSLKLGNPDLYESLAKRSKMIYLSNINEGVIKYLKDTFVIENMRTLDRFIEKHQHTQPEKSDKAVKLLNILKKHGGDNVMKVAREPTTEPLAIICHNDFLSNNIMFRYDSNGLATESKIIDFQTISYGPPAVDLSLLMYMNMENPQVRKEQWDSLWKVYYDNLIERIKLKMPEDFVIPEYLSLVSLLEDFKLNCYHAFFVVVFFSVLLPVGGDVAIAKFTKMREMQEEMKNAGDVNENFEIEYATRICESVETVEIVDFCDKLADDMFTYFNPKKFEKLL